MTKSPAGPEAGVAPPIMHGEPLESPPFEEPILKTRELAEEARYCDKTIARLRRRRIITPFIDLPGSPRWRLSDFARQINQAREEGLI